MKSFNGFLFLSIICFFLANTAYCQNSERIETIGSGKGAIKISLSAEWEKDEAISDLGSCTFRRKNPVVVFSILITDLGSNPGYNVKSYQFQFLESIKNALQADNKENAKFTNDELFGVPALIIYMDRGEGKDSLKEIHFLKDCKYYLISFFCKPSDFDEQWASIEPKIKSIDFAK